jgi:hypothetical protein
MYTFAVVNRGEKTYRAMPADVSGGRAAFGAALLTFLGGVSG